MGWRLININMNMDINNLFSMIDCNNTPEIQNKGIEIAKKVTDISPLILPVSPKYNKNVWENCAKIIANRSDEFLVPYLSDILEWLQDLNWPGAFVIVERLKKFNSKLLALPYTKAVIRAIDMQDDGQQWLDNLSYLIEKSDLAKLIDSKLLKILTERFYFGFWNGSS